jgi:hypothetical protein
MAAFGGVRMSFSALRADANAVTLIRSLRSLIEP